MPAFTLFFLIGREHIKMTSIKSLENSSFDAIYGAFSEAFVDYEMQLDKEELKAMLRRRGFIPKLSFGAFLNDKIIAFTFNGIGSFNDKKTAYDTGTGTIKEYRGQGHATKIFEYSIPFLKDAGVTQYLLEVLQHNSKAVSIYKKLGFDVSREFNYFLQENENLRFCSKPSNLNFQTKIIDLAQIDSCSIFCDFNPSWQNSIEAIKRNPVDFKIIGASIEHDLVGYCIFEPNSGDITQIAVDKRYRRNGIGTQLLKEVLKFNLNDSVKIINTKSNCLSITHFLEANSIPLSGKQFEMIKQL